MLLVKGKTSKRDRSKGASGVREAGGRAHRSGRFIQNKGAKAMGLAPYEIIGHDTEWRVRHDGKAENIYETKETAFEAAIAAASLALRQGHEVRVAAPGRGSAGGAEP
jgi:hypothetical protein